MWGHPDWCVAAAPAAALLELRPYHVCRSACCSSASAVAQACVSQPLVSQPHLPIDVPLCAGLEMQGGVLVAKKERGGFGLATFATGIVYGLQVRRRNALFRGLPLPPFVAGRRLPLLLSAVTTAVTTPLSEFLLLLRQPQPAIKHRLFASPPHPTPPHLQPDALFVIVPALALPTKLAAASYILMFVLGTVAAMGAYTGVIGERRRLRSGGMCWLVAGM